MDWMEFGLDGVDAVRIVVSCIVFYLGIIVLVRIVGQRALANLSSFDLAAIIALGAIVGRAILGDTPTLAAGVLAIGTLLILQALTGQARRYARIDGVVNSPAVVLMAGGEFLADTMARAHVDRAEVISKLRLAGIRQLSEVACVILEPTGQISVIRRGAPIDEDLLRGVVGADRVPREG
ncbi:MULTISPECIES: YetF domain-containing protein [unclassified Brevibacterium]|uniref:DUF421 domain-containing protein n=1 Tax=unclassified Brevibacterium TaxID=2614124 RepID=UPI0010F8F57B|nr:MULTISPECIES: YetF domain-containing protein [unclassified Brevibacterium]MCM1011201.1 DUF421 domain-containing protein [Brevibacterium sp. XM4083]